MGANLDSGATDVNGAFARINALLNDSEPASEPTEEETEQAAPAVESDESEPEGDDEPRYSVKVGGEEKEVTLEELRKGYMMGADYTRKTMELSEQRKQAEAKLADIDQRLSDAKEIIDLEVEWLESEEAKELRSYDPEAYLSRVEKTKAKAEKFAKLKAKRQEEHAAIQKERLAKEQEMLKQKIPDWLDEGTVQKEWGMIVDNLKGIGFGDEELNGITDHRLMVLARKAALYDQIMSTDVESKKVKTAPKSARPGVPQSSTQKASKEVKAVRQQLKDKGDMRSAAAAIKALMRG